MPCIKEHCGTLLCLFKMTKKIKAPHHADKNHPGTTHGTDSEHHKSSEKKKSAKNNAHNQQHQTTHTAHENTQTHHHNIGILDMKKFEHDIKAYLIQYNRTHPKAMWCKNPDLIVQIICCPQSPHHKIISTAFIDQYHKSHNNAIIALKTAMRQSENKAAEQLILTNFRSRALALKAKRVEAVHIYNESVHKFVAA